MSANFTDFIESQNEYFQVTVHPHAAHETSISRTLEPWYYTAASVLRHERNGGLVRTWHYAGHASQLSRAGDYFTFSIAGQNLFCIRGKDSKIRAFYNVCQHRAHELLEGKGNKKIITCPYHAWAYDLCGQLRGGPNLKAVAGLDPSKICLKSVRIENFHEFIFANLDDDAEPMDLWYPQVREQLSEYLPDIVRMQPLETYTIIEKCNWKISVENYSECYHCKINHQSLSTGVIDANTYDIQPQGHCLRHTAKTQNIERLSYAIREDDGSMADQYSNWYLWPMFAFQIYPGNVLNTYCWREIDENRVELIRDWYTRDGEDCATIKELAKLDWETTVAEDIRLVESVQRGIASRGYTPGQLVLDPQNGVDSEHSLKILQQWMRDSAQPAKQAETTLA